MQQITVPLPDHVVARFSEIGVEGDVRLKECILGMIEQSLSEEEWLLKLAKEGEASGYLGEEESAIFLQKMLNAKD